MLPARPPPLPVCTDPGAPHIRREGWAAMHAILTFPRPFLFTQTKESLEAEVKDELAAIQATLAAGPHNCLRHPVMRLFWYSHIHVEEVGGWMHAQCMPRVKIPLKQASVPPMCCNRYHHDATTKPELLLRWSCGLTSGASCYPSSSM